MSCLKKLFLKSVFNWGLNQFNTIATETVWFNKAPVISPYPIHKWRMRKFPLIQIQNRLLNNKTTHYCHCFSILIGLVTYAYKHSSTRTTITMDSFVEYLQNSKKSISGINASTKNPVHVIMGNESCDLDSMISALALGYLCYSRIRKTQPKPMPLVVPILNIPSDEFVLRTENCYVLKKTGIDQNVLVFRNEINLQGLQTNGRLQVSLVDHHVLRPEDRFLEAAVIEIYDHRPVDPQATWDDQKVQVLIRQVGSCSTIIADVILKESANILSTSLATLLNDVITFDTIAFSPEAGRVTELDVQVSKQLVKQFSLPPDPKILFDELWNAHNDVSHLTPKQLLSKDLKIVEGMPVPGLPMLVKEYFEFPEVVQDMISFCKDKNSSTMVIIGLHVLENGDSKQVHRDLAVFAFNNDKKLTNAIITSLKKAKELKGYDFCLEEVAVSVPDVTYFVQKNVRLTRKHILPLIKEAVVQHVQS